MLSCRRKLKVNYIELLICIHKKSKIDIFIILLSTRLNDLHSIWLKLQDSKITLIKHAKSLVKPIIQSWYIGVSFSILIFFCVAY